MPRCCGLLQTRPSGAPCCTPADELPPAASQYCSYLTDCTTCSENPFFCNGRPEARKKKELKTRQDERTGGTDTHTHTHRAAPRQQSQAKATSGPGISNEETRIRIGAFPISISDRCFLIPFPRNERVALHLHLHSAPLHHCICLLRPDRNLHQCGRGRNRSLCV